MFAWSCEITSGLGSEALIIDQLEVPVGRDSIIIWVEVPQFTEGIFENQAMISNLPASLGALTLSDNPKTLEPDDPTPLEVIPIFVDLAQDSFIICEEECDTLALSSCSSIQILEILHQVGHIVRPENNLRENKLNHITAVQNRRFNISIYARICMQVHHILPNKCVGHRCRKWPLNQYNMDETFAIYPMVKALYTQNLTEIHYNWLAYGH